MHNEWFKPPMQPQTIAEGPSEPAPGDHLTPVAARAGSEPPLTFIPGAPADAPCERLEEIPARRAPDDADGTTDQAVTGSSIPPEDDSALFRVDVAVTGMNAALQRPLRCEIVAAPLLARAGFIPAWKPYWPKPKVFGITFPEGLNFLPPKPDPAARPVERLAPLQPADPSAAPRPRATRIRPPADALSLEDRLFYVLQPPLESWLRGQELVMPFEPFPYQYEGIAWLFSQRAALLADEMGLGKTMQTITALRLLLRAGQVRRVLLVCPKPLIPNWQREFKTWAEEIPLTTLEGDGPRRQMLWRLPGAIVLLCNYELLVRDFQALLREGAAPTHDGLGRAAPETAYVKSRGRHGEAPPDLPQFDLVVLDEAQRIKNRESVTSATARAIPRKRSLALTGTPIENRPEELAVLFEFLGVVPPAGAPDVRQLTRLARDYVLRRTKNLVMKDMPPRLDRDEYIELGPAQRAAYEAAEKEGVFQLNELGESISIQHVFELVMRLKQIANFDPATGESTKLERVRADMEEIAASGGKAILFSQWTRTLGWLNERLQEYGPLMYHGGIPSNRREPVLQQFKEDPDKHIILMSYATGAVGLNLQFAGYVFLYDRWWNPAVEDQAINRAHRIGCKSAVIVSKFICKDTIEEKIDKVLREKRDLFARVLGEGDDRNDSLSLSASEIFGLFDLKARTRNGAKPLRPAPQSRSDDDAPETAEAA